MSSQHAWPEITGIAFGGDYTPEQWSRETWAEDVVLMREAGVTLVSVGIFAWALLETSEGVYDFEWLDEVIDLLHENGIAVDLGTPTASPPAWFFAAYPDAHVVTRDGVTMGFGSRGMASHSSPEYKAASVGIARKLAERYSGHPAVVLWHVHNEYGVPVGEDYSENAVIAFRVWLREKYRDLDTLNAAWGTAFWGQNYSEWDHIGAPAIAPSVVNQSQRLDFARFTDDQLRACFVAERDAIREFSDKPVTTNFMANATLTTNLWAWGQEVDIVSDDHYLWAADTEGEIGLAIAADLSRSVGNGKPWILMEHSTSAVNWQPRNIAKRPGELARNSLAHFARGADAILFFQWRASRSGAEKFHSAMLPHAGTESRVWREVVALGTALPQLAEARGSRVVAEVAILWDFESFWAQGLEWRPSIDLDHAERVRAFYEELWRSGITVDFALPGHDLSAYALVIAPAQYLLSTKDAANLEQYVANGGTLAVSYFSAIVDENDAVHEGGYGAPLKNALGLVVEEFLPLREGVTLDVDFNGTTLTADVWQEALQLNGADVIASFADGTPAVTRNGHGDGTGWYFSTRLDAAGLHAVMTDVLNDAGVARASEGVELVTRRGETNDYVIAINHGDAAAGIPVAGFELLTQSDVDETHHLNAGAVAIIRTERSTTNARPTGPAHTHRSN